MRRKFGKIISEIASKDKKVRLVVGDIGYGIFDEFRNSLLWNYFIDMIYELKFWLITTFNILELSFNSYVGILLIIIGLVVRLNLKFSIQKNL